MIDGAFGHRCPLRRDHSDDRRPQDAAARAAQFVDPAVAIAGYTNAGKSSPVNRLTGAGCGRRRPIRDADPTVRRVRPPPQREVTVSDTVGIPCVTCRINWSRRSGRRWKRSASPTSSCMWSMARCNAPEAQLAAVCEVLADLDHRPP